MNDTFKVELSTQLQSLIDYPLSKDNIHDDTGFFYYIQALTPGRPLLMIHYRGPLMAVLPEADYQRLGNGELSVEEYIANSFWNFGYLWGRGDLLSGVYWRPLESEVGIHDTARINRYLNILGCRTLKNSSGSMPSPNCCKQCKLDETKCPFSPANQFGDWKNEVQELDGRVALFSAIDERLQKEIGFKVTVTMSYHGNRNELLLFRASKLGTVMSYVSATLLNDLLYYPGERDWAAIAQSLDITLGICWETGRASLNSFNGDKHTACLTFWGISEPAPQQQKSQHCFWRRLLGMFTK